MYDTRTPADLGYRPSPTRAERDTWTRPALTVRPIRIAAGVRDAVTAAYTHPMPAGDEGHDYTDGICPGSPDGHSWPMGLDYCRHCNAYADDDGNVWPA